MYIMKSKLYNFPMHSYTIAEARASLADAIDACSDEPIQITRHGKPVAVLVEPGIYERLADALEELEDIRDFDVAMGSDLKRVPWEQVKRDLGLA
jgi:prevent-host-death family protein